MSPEVSALPRVDSVSFSGTLCTARGNLSSILKGRQAFIKLTSHFLIGLLRDLPLHHLDPVQLQIERVAIW